MYLDHLCVREEVVAVTRIGDTLRLRLRWRWEDIPLLFSLPPELLLRWAHLDDPKAGVPVTVERWTWRPGPLAESEGASLQLRLRLTAPRQKRNSPTCPAHYDIYIT